MVIINKIQTPYGEGTLADNMPPDWISVRLPVNELTLTIPPERIVTRGKNMGLFIFKLSELGEL